MTGIYKIESILKPEKVYIGSAKDIDHRWRCHKSDLLKNKHSNNILQNHVNKYGLDDLKFSIVMSCSKKQLLDTEQYYIDLYEPHFNILKIAGRSTGHSWKKTPEAIEKTRRANLGRPLSEEHKKKLSEAHKGKKLSKEHRAKISAGLTGIKRSDEYKKMISDRNKRLGIKPPSRKGKRRS